MAGASLPRRGRLPEGGLEPRLRFDPFYGRKVSDFGDGKGLPRQRPLPDPGRVAPVPVFGMQV